MNYDKLTLIGMDERGGPIYMVPPQHKELPMTDRKEKFSGMALEMDVIKKIGHQLERLQPGSEDRVLAFVKDWSAKQSIAGDFGKNGQLPLAADKDAFG